MEGFRALVYLKLTLLFRYEIGLTWESFFAVKDTASFESQAGGQSANQIDLLCHHKLT